MYIAKFGKLPTGYEPEVQIAGYGGSYAFFPCFPYMIMGAIMRAEYLCGLPDYILIYTARLVNVTSGVLMAVGVRKLAGRVFNDRGAAWVFAFAVMFWPEQLFVHTYVNCESMSQLSIVIILLALVGLYQDGPGERNCILLSAGLILCILTYYNAYGYVLAAVALFFGWFAIRIHETKRGAGITAGAGTEMDKTSENSGSYGSTAGNAAKVLIGAGWWFVRSGILHNGDLFGLKTLSESRAPREELFGLTYYEQGKSVFTMFKETGLARTLLRSFIACYGSLSIWAGPWLYRFDEIFLFGGAALCIVFRIMRTVRSRGRAPAEFRVLDTHVFSYHYDSGDGDCLRALALLLLPDGFSGAGTLSSCNGHTAVLLLYFRMALSCGCTENPRAGPHGDLYSRRGCVRISRGGLCVRNGVNPSPGSQGFAGDFKAEITAAPGGR